MVPDRNRLAFIALLLGVAAASFGSGYVAATRRAEQDQLSQFYASSASGARSVAIALTQLRTAGDERAIELLESQLSIQLVSLGGYEKHTPPARRSKQIYFDVAVVRDYYAKFPEARPSLYAAETLTLGMPSQRAP